MSAAAFTPASKVKLPLSAFVAIAFAVATSGGSLALAQYRINDVAERVAAIEQARAADRELLVRIDERTAEMKRILEAVNRRP